MKIGILTYHRAINYGAIFQAYALMTYLKDLGHEVEIIDYWPQYHIDEYKIFNSNDFANCSILGKMRFLGEYLLKYTRTRKRNNGCLNFMYDNFNIGKHPKYLTGESIKEDYDLAFYGSDQIWWKTPKIKNNRGFDEVYFGKFPIEAQKKASYAASMGVIDLNPLDKKKLTELLYSFDSISVREYDLLKIVQECGFQAEMALDPVFLLDKTKWEKLIPQKFNKKQEKYIFFYHHTYSPEAKKLVKQLSNQFGCKIIEVNSCVLPYALGAKYKNSSSPGEFLGLLRDAEFVVTTSFHGTVFSVLMEKQFFALGMGKNAERSKSLLKTIGLSNLYLESDHITPIKIDYNEVNTKLNHLKNSSISYINTFTQ